jgi:hypothetical protein
MHHKSPDSQDVYTQPELEEAARHLDAAMVRLSQSQELAALPGMRLPELPDSLQ